MKIIIIYQEWAILMLSLCCRTLSNVVLFDRKYNAISPEKSSFKSDPDINWDYAMDDDYIIRTLRGMQLLSYASTSRVVSSTEHKRLISSWITCFIDV